MIEPIKNYEIKRKLNNDNLYSGLKEQLNELEQSMVKQIDASNHSLSENLKRVVLAGGKRLRPSLAYLCYQIGEGQKMEILPLMSMLELMHTASLIHDDVVDDAIERRGVITIHKVSGKHVAVQSGDYLLAKAMDYLHIYKGTGINEALAEISTQMCLGEFQQIKSLFQSEEQNIDRYFLQIKRKTAYLLATSCFTGAIAGGLSKEDTEALRLYGENIGIAFQLKDDILDYQGSKEYGKPIAQDIKRGIFTLPLLYAFENNPDQQMKSLAEKKDKTKEEVDALMHYVIYSQGLSHTELMLRIFSNKAISAIDSIKECSEKNALIELAKTLVKRKL